VKFAYVTQTINQREGQGRVCVELIKYVLGKGHQVWMFADFVEPELVKLGAQWTPIRPFARGPALLFEPQFVYLADRALRKCESEMDIIHGFGYSLSRPHHVNSAQFVHRAWGRSPAHPARRSRTPQALYQLLHTKMNTHLEKVAFTRSKVIVACSEMVKDELIDAAIPATKIRVQWNGVDLDEFTHRDGLRAAWNLPEGVPLFLFAGDIRSPRKNLRTVLHALQGLPAAHLVVVGALARSPYPALAESLGVSPRVHFLDFRNDLPAIMSVVDAFVFPSQYEPFGSVVLEAMACRLPVITALSVGASALITPDSGIILDDPTDVGALRLAMAQLISDPARRQRMGTCARSLAAACSWRRTAESFFEIYEEVCRSKPRAAGT
jgi:glycosyltransferase involved in cell wall biosynthesis